MPGQEAQPIHRDRWAWGARLRGFEPQLNTIWALTDFTTENGAHPGGPRLVRLARRPQGRAATRSPRPRWTPARCCSTPAPSSTVAGANRSDGDRIGLNITYALGWLRQEENQYLSCPPDIARTLDPELQELIGYSIGPVRARLLHAAAAAG